MTNSNLILAVAIALSVSEASNVDAQHPMVLTLGGAARMAADNSAKVEIARANVGAVEARARQTRADLLPSISGVLTDNERTFNTAGLGLDFRDPVSGQGLFSPGGEVIGPVRTLDARAIIRQSVIDVAAHYRVRAADNQATVAREEVGASAEDAAATAAVGYVRAMRAGAQLTARETDSALAAELLVLAQKQRAAGLGISLDVARAAAQAAATRAELITARSERDRTMLELRRALGVPFETPLTLADSLVDSTDAVPDLEQAIDQALRSRTDLRAIDGRRTAARQQLAAAKAERLPALLVFADRGNVGNGTTRMLNTYTWGWQVSVPVFDGLRRESRVDEQRASVRALDLTRRDATQQAILDVRNAMLGLTSAREQLAASGERLALAEQELQLARTRFAAGVAGNAEVITALIALDAARVSSVDARAAVQTARVMLAHAQGSVASLP
jgi:outer membrane protein